MSSMSRLKKSCLALAVSQALIAPTYAADIVVNSNDDMTVVVKDELCTLREAIMSAQANNSSNGDCVDGDASSVDKINFDGSDFAGSSTITLTSSLPEISSELSIKGTGDLVIDGNSNSAIFLVNDGRLEMSELTISNGSSGQGAGIFATNGSVIELKSIKMQENYVSNDGGAIYLSGSQLTLTSSTLTSNASFGAGGGGIAALSGSSLEIMDSVISHNQGKTDGGAVFLDDSSLDLKRSMLLNNSLTYTGTDRSGKGGAIAFKDFPASTNLHQVSISDSQIYDNTANRGGGIYASGNFDLTIDRSVISNNRADLIAGIGVASETGSLTITNSSVLSNVADGFSGAIFVSDVSFRIVSSTVSYNTSTVGSGGITTRNSAGFVNGVIDNSTFSYNVSGADGGGLSRGCSALIVRNTTVTGNTAIGIGGGIDVTSGADLELFNSILSGNNASSGSEITVSSTSTFDGNNNIFSEDSTSVALAVTGFLPQNYGIVASSDGNTPTTLNSILLPLDSNGGFTQTHLLALMSPAINAGDNLICAAANVNNLDQRGLPRPVQGICDIGSVELTQQELPDDSTMFVVPLPNGNTVIFDL